MFLFKLFLIDGIRGNSMYEYLVNNFLVSFDRLNVLRQALTIPSRKKTVVDSIFSQGICCEFLHRVILPHAVMKALLSIARPHSHSLYVQARYLYSHS